MMQSRNVGYSFPSNQQTLVKLGQAVEEYYSITFSN